MASRLADILNQEYKSKGLISGASSALGKRAKEKYDFRNILFGGSGIGSIVGRKVFGKGYSATDKESKIKVGSKISEESSALGTGTSSVLQEISTNSKTTAQNTMALPRMADDMSVMKDNIIRLAGGRARGRSGSNNRPSASLRATNFFSKSKESETAYESKFGKKTSPTKVESKKDDSGILGIIGGILGVLGAVFGTLATTVGLAVAAFTTLISGLSLFGGAILGVLGFIGRFLPFGKIGKVLGLVGLGGLALDAFGAFGKTAANTTPGATETGKEEKSGLVKGVVNTTAGIAGTLAAGSAVSGATKLLSTGAGSLKEKTSTSILDAKQISSVSNKMEGPLSLIDKSTKSAPTSLWGRFLNFLANRKTLLFRKVGLRLATAGTLLAIPVIGWVIALFQLGFSVLTAYEIYAAWKEFNDEEDKEAKGSPTQISSSDDNLNKLNATGTNPITPTQNTPPMAKTKWLGNTGLLDAIIPSAHASQGSIDSSGGLTFNKLSKEQQDALMEEQRKQEGFRPGSLTYDLNNPGAIQYSPAVDRFGGVRDTTGRGDSAHKGTFAKFPTLADGVEAQRDLWSRKYGNMPIQQALAKWSPTAAGTGYSENIIAAAISGKPSSGATSSQLAQQQKPTPTIGSKLDSYNVAKRDANKKSGDVIIAGNNNNNNSSQPAPAQQTASVGAPSPYDSELAKILFTPMTL